MSEAMKAMDSQNHYVTQEMIAKIKAEVNYDLIKKNNHDKYGDGEYISVETVTDILNETFRYTWSWEIVTFIDKGDYVVCHGRLTIPGVGVRDGIGQALANKKDNSSVYAAAASYAFKSAAKRIGIAPNIFNKEGIGFDVFEPGTVVVPLNEATYKDVPALPVDVLVNLDDDQQAYKEVATTVEQPVKKPEVQSKKQVPLTSEEKAVELKEAYKITKKSEFVAFAQIWNPEITKFEEITSAVIEELHAYAEENPEEFEDFVASLY